MNYSETVITVDNIINNYSDGINIIDFVKALALHIHLTVNAMNTLDSAGNARIRHNKLYSFADFFLNTVKILFSL